MSVLERCPSYEMSVFRGFTVYPNTIFCPIRSAFLYITRFGRSQGIDSAAHHRLKPSFFFIGCVTYCYCWLLHLPISVGQTFSIPREVDLHQFTAIFRTFEISLLKIVVLDKYGGQNILTNSSLFSLILALCI